MLPFSIMLIISVWGSSFEGHFLKLTVLCIETADSGWNGEWPKGLNFQCRCSFNLFFFMYSGVPHLATNISLFSVSEWTSIESILAWLWYHFHVVIGKDKNWTQPFDCKPSSPTTTPISLTPNFKMFLPRNLNFRTDEFQNFFCWNSFDFFCPQSRDRFLKDATPQRNKIAGSDHQSVHKLKLKFWKIVIYK